MEIQTPPQLLFRTAPIIPDPDKVREELVEDRKKAGEPVDRLEEPLKEPPLSLYEQARHRPYSADYFGLGSEWEHWNFPKEFQSIEEFVKGEIKSQVLNDSVDSYKEIVEGLENKIGKRENERVWHRLDRLVSYINAVKNFRKWEGIKRKFEEMNA
jgi:hypothetical protein